MRLFVAVDLTDAARARITSLLAVMRRSLAGAGVDDSFKWVAPANLHLTLRFLGSVPDDHVEAVTAAMRLPIDRSGFPITLGRPGTFPARGRPRVLHVPVEGSVEVLRGVRDEIDARLAPLCTWEHESRPFAPHLTLARARDRSKFNPIEFSRLIDDVKWDDVRFDITKVTLFKSRTLPAGPEYTKLAEARLRSV